MKTQKQIFALAFLILALAVICGAFGAHVIRETLQLGPDSIRIFQTGVSYHFYHGFAIAICGLVYPYFSTKLVKLSSKFFLVGIFLFSGSLYLLSTRTALGIESWTNVLGPATPLGGLCFIIAWLLLFVAALKMKGSIGVK